MTEVKLVQPQQPGRIDNEKFPQIISVVFNELINDEGVCRTAPATPGLLMTKVFVEQPWLHRVC